MTVDVKLLATYLPNHREFNVLLKTSGLRLFEKMSISKFMRVARSPDKPLVIDGVTVKFDRPEFEKPVRDYLKQVADSYLESTQQNHRKDPS